MNKVVLKNVYMLQAGLGLTLPNASMGCWHGGGSVFYAFPRSRILNQLNKLTSAPSLPVRLIHRCDLYMFFFSKSAVFGGVRLIQRCDLYTGKYGNMKATLCTFDDSTIELNSLKKQQ